MATTTEVFLTTRPCLRPNVLARSLGAPGPPWRAPAGNILPDGNALGTWLLSHVVCKSDYG
jgi:hypothetical protein